MYLYVLLYICVIQTSRTNLNSMCFSTLKTKKNVFTVHIFFKLQIRPAFQSEERLDNLVRRGECFAGLSILLVYAYSTSLAYPFMEGRNRNQLVLSGISCPDKLFVSAALSSCLCKRSEPDAGSAAFLDKLH